MIKYNLLRCKSRDLQADSMGHSNYGYRGDTWGIAPPIDNLLAADIYFRLILVIISIFMKVGNS